MNEHISTCHSTLSYCFLSSLGEAQFFIFGVLCSGIFIYDENFFSKTEGLFGEGFKLFWKCFERVSKLFWNGFEKVLTRFWQGFENVLNSFSKVFRKIFMHEKSWLCSTISCQKTLRPVKRFWSVATTAFFLVGSGVI